MRIKCFTCGRGAWIGPDDFKKDFMFCPFCDEPLEEFLYYDN